MAKKHQLIRAAGLILLFTVILSGKPEKNSFDSFAVAFIKGYRALNIPEFTFDYKEYFAAIPSDEGLQEELDFFTAQQTFAAKLDTSVLGPGKLLQLRQIRYEIAFNILRIGLERSWIRGGKINSPRGLSWLPEKERWYRFFVKKYTSLDLGPEEIMKLGKREVARCRAELARIRTEQGFKDSISFYERLGDSTFFIKNKKDVLDAFARVDAKVRVHLKDFLGQVAVPPVYPMEWPGAGYQTPPGIYLNHRDNPYGKDVFQFNFSSGVFNKRAVEWLYMHEAIPGHHLQFTFSKPSELDALFIYPGNFEGWGCYVEYFGKELGLYSDPYAETGKWEWDLVRSARLVIDAGIHYYGWTYEQALAYWKAEVPGQDAIADREITRVTNWPCQALSYKVGADFIFRLRDKWKEKFPERSFAQFHEAYLGSGKIPLPVLEQTLLR